MSLICAVCGIESNTEEMPCIECGSKKFLKRDLTGDYLPAGHILLKKYRIINFIKAGGVGAVYKACDLNEKKLFAVKELLNTSQEEETNNVLLRFKREAKILSELSHPSLPGIIDYFVIQNRYYLIIDYIEGKDLEEILAEEGELTELQVVDWAVQICDVLDYLHHKIPPIIYRDIKPSNIMLRNDGKIMLIDFGIARTITPEEKEYTMTSIGTIGYVSPEQYKGKPEPRSDIYSLGVTIYKLLTGTVPLPFSLKPIKKLRPNISDNLEAIIMKAVMMKASKRFSDTQEMKNALLGNIIIAESPVKEEKTQADILLEELASPDANLRYIVIKSLEKYIKNSKVSDVLINLLEKEQDLIVRIEIITILSKLEDRKLIATFNKTLGEEHPEIRLTSIEALERFRDSSSPEPLIKALSYKETQINLKAAKLLIDFKEKKALPELFKLLQRQTEPEIVEELEKGIDRIDPLYLIEWKKQKSKKNKSKTLTGLFIILLLVLTGYILYNNFLKTQELKILVDEGKKDFSLYNYDLALEKFNRAFKLSPDSPEVNYLIGKTLIYTEPSRAKGYLDKAINLKKDYFEPLTGIGILYLRNNDLQNAVDCFQKALILKENDPETCLYLATAYYREGKKDEAEELFKKITSLPADDKIIRFTDSWLKKISSEKISSEIKTEIENRLLNGENSINNSDYNAASIEFDFVIDKNPDDARGYLGMARIYLLKGQNITAMQFFSDTIKRDPLCVEAYYNIACLYLEENDYEKALKYLREGDYFSPGEPDIHYLMGIVHNKLNNKENALKELNIYLNLAPQGKYVKEVKKIIENYKED